MTIASATSKSGPYAGNGVTVAFAIGFACSAASDLSVVRTDTNAADTTLALNTDYTVALNADQTNSPGGTVTMVSAPATGFQVTILRNVALTQGTSLPNQGGWYPRVIENAFDKLTMIVQQLSEKVSRSVVAGVTLDPSTLVAQIFNAANSAAASAASAAEVLADAANSAGSSLVGFIQAGVGAVIRTVQDRFRDTVHADDFDTLQHALDTGKVVRLTDGKTYVLTGQLNPPSGGGLIGKGVLTADAATTYTATTYSQGATCAPIRCDGVSNITLRGFKIVVTPGTNSYTVPVMIDSCTDVDVFGLDISGLNAGLMVAVNSSDDVSVRNCYLHDSEIDRTGSTSQLSGIDVDGNRPGANSTGISIKGNRIERLTVTSAFLAAYGYQTDGINPHFCSDMVVSGNTVDTVGEGIDTSVTDSVFFGNILRNCYIFGIKLIHGASRNLVYGNRIINPGLGGINVSGGNVQATDSNQIFGNLVSGVDPNGVWAPVDATYAYGVNNDGTYLASNNVFRDNVIRSATGAESGLLVGSTGTGNAFYRTDTDGTPATPYIIAAGTAKIETINRVGDYTGKAWVSGTDPLLRLEETDAGANVKVWEWLSSAGSLILRTATDLYAAGVNCIQFTRSGTTVSKIQIDATSVQFGGQASATQYKAISSTGTETVRHDIAGNYVQSDWQNYGITASGHGVDTTWSFGTGAALGATALRKRVFSTDTWAASGNRSAREITDISYQGTLTRCLDIDPSIGFQVSNMNLLVITAGRGLGIKSGSNCKIGSFTLAAGSATVANTSITSTSIVLASCTTSGGTRGHMSFAVNAGVGFTATSSSGTDTSTFSYVVVEPI